MEPVRMLLKACLLMASVYGASRTGISIDDTNFKINGEVTYNNAANSNVHGLLINSRMINSIFDDANSSTQYLWRYPDTDIWDPQRNTNEFVGNLTTYKNYGMLSFTVGLQGGDPFGYERNEPANISGQPWIVSGYNQHTGDLIVPFFNRLSQILKEADSIGMIPMIQLFYPNQQFSMSDTSKMNAINKTLDWLMTTGYTNILIEVCNECNACSGILAESNMPDTIDYIRKYTNGKYLIGSSLTGGTIPTAALIAAADMVLLHGGGGSSATTNMINQVRESSGYKSKPKPIMFNEDPNTYFASDFKSAVDNHASWGVFIDCNQTTAGDYIYGYQCVPSAWNLNTPKKQSFFKTVQNYTKSQ